MNVPLPMADGPGGVQNENPTGGGIDNASTLATFCHPLGLYTNCGMPVFLYAGWDRDKSDSRKGPSSTSRPYRDEAPGPPLNHWNEMMNGIRRNRTHLKYSYRRYQNKWCCFRICFAFHKPIVHLHVINCVRINKSRKLSGRHRFGRPSWKLFN